MKVAMGIQGYPIKKEMLEKKSRKIIFERNF